MFNHNVFEGCQLKKLGRNGKSAFDWIKKNIKRKSVKKLKDILEQNMRKTKIHRWQHEVSSSNEISKWSYFALF